MNKKLPAFIERANWVTYLIFLVIGFFSAFTSYLFEFFAWLMPAYFYGWFLYMGAWFFYLVFVSTKNIVLHWKANKIVNKQIFPESVAEMNNCINNCVYLNKIELADRLSIMAVRYAEKGLLKP